MRRRRQGFTLVELLVAMALVMFIMAILSQAFAAATQTFRDLKSAADMAEKLRTTTGIMRRYLASDHFEGKRRLSDPNFWQNGPPREGFFRVWHGAPSFFEGHGLDANEPPSLLSTSHALHFTVKLRGNQRDDYFSATPVSGSPLPGLPQYGSILWQAQPETRYEDSVFPASVGALYNWQWAEVAFFLQPTGDNANGTPLYALYLRHMLSLHDNFGGTSLGVSGTLQSSIPGYLEVSCQPDPSGATSNLYFNTPLDLTMPIRRFNMWAPGITPNLAGWPIGWPGGPPNLYSASNPFPYPRFQDQMQGVTAAQISAYASLDLLLANVISFDVRLLTALPPTGSTGGPYAGANWDAFEDLFQLTSSSRSSGGVPSSYGVNNPTFSASGPLVFDTWSSNRDDTYDYTSWATPGTPASIPILNNAQGVPITIRAVQVTLRVWDEKTQLTRQVTFVQEL
ncbi:MAG TPA: prepilin-type N-terminal cleavage/methylation domain-containing protein [Gemmataceae bacterium]